MSNVLTNQRLNNFRDAMIFYREFFWDTHHMDWSLDSGSFRRLKMIVRQYQAYRVKVRQFTTIQEILDWVNFYSHEVLMVPMNSVDNRRMPMAPKSVYINQVWHTPDINVAFRYFPGSDEELHGPGVMATMKVYPIRGTRFDPDAWRFGLASHGIYCAEGNWTDDGKENYWEFEVTILDVDFKLTDLNDPRWAFTIPKDDDMFDMDEIFDDEYAR